MHTSGIDSHHQVRRRGQTQEAKGETKVDRKTYSEKKEKNNSKKDHLTGIIRAHKKLSMYFSFYKDEPGKNYLWCPTSIIHATSTKKVFTKKWSFIMSKLYLHYDASITSVKY